MNHIGCVTLRGNCIGSRFCFDPCIKAIHQNQASCRRGNRGKQQCVISSRSDSVSSAGSKTAQPVRFQPFLIRSFLHSALLVNCSFGRLFLTGESMLRTSGYEKLSILLSKCPVVSSILVHPGWYNCCNLHPWGLRALSIFPAVCVLNRHCGSDRRVVSSQGERTAVRTESETCTGQESIGNCARPVAICAKCLSSADWF